MKGTVKFFSAEKGWGFITPDDGSTEAFVHHSEIVGSGYRTLEADACVQFEVTRDDRGTRATGVVVIGPCGQPQNNDSKPNHRKTEHRGQFACKSRYPTHHD